MRQALVNVQPRIEAALAAKLIAGFEAIRKDGWKGMKEADATKYGAATAKHLTRPAAKLPSSGKKTLDDVVLPALVAWLHAEALPLLFNLLDLHLPADPSGLMCFEGVRLGDAKVPLGSPDKPIEIPLRIPYNPDTMLQLAHLDTTKNMTLYCYERDDDIESYATRQAKMQGAPAAAPVEHPGQMKIEDVVPVQVPAAAPVEPVAEELPWCRRVTALPDHVEPQDQGYEAALRNLDQASNPWPLPGEGETNVPWHGWVKGWEEGAHAAAIRRLPDHGLPEIGEYNCTRDSLRFMAPADSNHCPSCATSEFVVPWIIGAPVDTTPPAAEAVTDAGDGKVQPGSDPGTSEPGKKTVKRKGKKKPDAS